ncbi:Chondroitin sulfate ABC endolyase [Pontiella sulfatireligans]|uniref:Chondroitin sulfate ABC endolyase n=2 Tax=Pontiella sulfatireligans TaxID=2750658 RepID=A0A6C2UIB8_9BACT|nr:Chondroitin sulfate ABC endolyase [Pontiella sulfatireligans]
MGFVAALFTGCVPENPVEPAENIIQGDSSQAEGTPAGKKAVDPAFSLQTDDAFEKENVVLQVLPWVHAAPAPIKLGAPLPIEPDSDGLFLLEFEGSGLPKGLDASNSKVSIDTARRIRGDQALRWDWNAGAELKFQLPIACAPKWDIRDQNNFPATRVFKFWIYNEEPLPEKQLKIVFGDEQGEPCSFPVNLDFSGWRTAWVSYQRDMQGKPDRDLAYVRFIAPEDVESGTFWIDDISPSLLIDKRHQTADWQVPFLSKHKQSVYAFGAGDVNLMLDRSVDKASFEGKLSAADRAAFSLIEEKLSAFYDPKAGDVDALERRFLNYGIVKDATGVIRGAYLPYIPCHSVGYPKRLKAQLNAMKKNKSDMYGYSSLMLDIARNYLYWKDEPSGNRNAERLKTLFVLMSEHLLDQGWQAGSSQGTTHHFGYASRNWSAAVFLMRNELEQAGLLESMTDSMVWYFSTKRHFLDPPSKVVYNMDYLNTFAFSDLLTLASLPDSPWKAHFLGTFSKSLSTGLCVPSPGNQGGIKSDGSLFHHHMHYTGYGLPAMGGVVKLVDIFDGTPYEFSTEVYGVLKLAFLRAQLWGYPWSGLNACGRHPLVAENELISSITKQLALSKPGTDGCDIELAAAYLSMEGGEAQKIFGQTIEAEDLPLGAWSMNYHGGGIYKYGNSSVQLKGYGNGVRSHETYKDDNRYGRYGSHGTIMVFKNTRKHPSGFLQPGWAWSQPPGATTLMLNPDQLEGHKGNSGLRVPQNTPFGGSAHLDNEIGLFGFQLDRVDGKPHEQSIQMRKSVLSIDGKLICLGSDLSGSSKYPLATTLFQSGLRKGNDIVIVEGSKMPLKQPISKGWKTGGILPSWLIDPYGTGHYIAPGSQFKLTIGKQVSKHNKTRKLTEGEFSLAWLEHGIFAKNASYEYVSLLDADVGMMQRFDKQMASSKPFYYVKRKNAATHAIHVPEHKVWALVNFEPLADPVGPILEVSQPCFVLMKQLPDESIRLSVTDPRLELTETTTAAPVDVVLRIKGRYRLTGSEEGVLATVVSGNTELTVRCAEGQSTAFTIESM